MFFERVVESWRVFLEGFVVVDATVCDQAIVLVLSSSNVSVYVERGLFSVYIARRWRPIVEGKPWSWFFFS